MTIDERLEKLTERHEALTQSVELLRIAQADTDKRFRETERRFTQIADLFVSNGQLHQRSYTNCEIPRSPFG